MDRRGGVSRRRGGAARGGGPCRARCAGWPRRARGGAGAQNAGSVSLTAARRASSAGGPSLDGHDDGGDDVAPLVVGRAGDGDVEDAATVAQRRLDRLRPHVLAARDDEVAGAARRRAAGRRRASARCRRSPASRRRRGRRCRRGRRAAASGRAGGSAPSSSMRTSTPSSGRPSYTTPLPVSVMPYVVTTFGGRSAGGAAPPRTIVRKIAGSMRRSAVGDERHVGGADAGHEHRVEAGQHRQRRRQRPSPG